MKSCMKHLLNSFVILNTSKIAGEVLEHHRQRERTLKSAIRTLPTSCCDSTRRDCPIFPVTDEPTAWEMGNGNDRACRGGGMDPYNVEETDVSSRRFF